MSSIKVEKKWQLMPKITKESIKKYPGYNPVILQLLYNRGLTEKNEIESFLNPGDNIMNDPFLFRNMGKALDLIISHIKNKNKIVVYGDYDADGVTSSTILVETLNVLKADSDVYIPNRVTEGYGLNKGAIEIIKKMGAKLIITVDGGIRNKEEVEYAKILGLDVIITDHHTPSDDENNLPDCLIINPLVKNESYPFKQLAGVGVAFKLAKALIGKAKITDEEKRKLEDRMYDLVAIGTVSDCVTVLGENRYFIKRGLEILNQKKRKGLNELIKIAQVSGAKRLDSWNIGFQIGPRLNAAGRLEHANTSFELLITKNENDAEEIARKLNERNSERQKITEEIMAEVEAQINPEDKILIGVCPEDYETEAWKEGVIGLVAGKISDKYYRPALVITRSENGMKGSGRSIEEFNLIRAIDEASEFLTRYGGHPAACGFSLLPENLDGFVKKIKEIANMKLKGVELKPKIIIETEIGLEEINEELFGEIEKFGPFGNDNNRPVFVSKGTIVDKIFMGAEGQHVKFKLKNEKSGLLSAIGFGQSENFKDFQIGDTIDIVYYLDLNEFNGRREIQLKILDSKASRQTPFFLNLQNVGERV